MYNIVKTKIPIKFTYAIQFVRNSAATINILSVAERSQNYRKFK